MDVPDAYGSLTFLVISIVIAHFIRPGWLEFDWECKTIRMVSVVQRQFEIASWSVILKPLPIISLSLGSELLICRDGALEFSIRVRETDGKESIICGLWPLGYREGIKLARSIEERTGLATRLRAMAVNATGKHEVEWTQQSNRKHFRIMAARRIRLCNCDARRYSDYLALLPAMICRPSSLVGTAGRCYGFSSIVGQLKRYARIAILSIRGYWYGSRGARRRGRGAGPTVCAQRYERPHANDGQAA
jgi:hypothetical protein